MRLVFTFCLICFFVSTSLAQGLKSQEQSESHYYAFAFTYGKDKTLMITEIQKVDLIQKPGQSQRIAEFSFRSANKPNFISFVKGNYGENFNPSYDYTRTKTFEVSNDREALTALFDKRVEKAGEDHLIIDGFSFLKRDYEGPIVQQEMH